MHHSANAQQLLTDLPALMYLRPYYRLLLCTWLCVAWEVLPVHAEEPPSGDRAVIAAPSDSAAGRHTVSEVPAIAADGRRFPARLVAIDEQGAVELAVGADITRLSPGGLVLWGAAVDVAPPVAVLLAGGGIIAAEEVSADVERLHLTSATLGPLDLPLEIVASLVFQSPSDPISRDQLWRRATSSQARGDQVALDNGDLLTGDVLSIGPGAVELRTETGNVSIPLTRLVWVGWNPSLVDSRALGQPRILVGLADGSILPCRRLIGRGEQWQLYLGDDLGAGASASPVLVQALDGPCRYLSDLEAASYRHVPFLEQSWPYRRDRSVTDTRLRAAGQVFAKGLGMHSASRVTYPLDGHARRFEADIAIDSSVDSGQGSVVFRVFLDADQKYVSPIVRGGAPPVAVSLELGGARTISLVIDYADRGDLLDHANWLNARLCE